MRILGIDPGIARVGWGVIENQSLALRRSLGQEFKVLNYGCLETSSKQAIAERLAKIHASILKIITQYKPDAMITEQLFFNTNAKTALIVGHARGVVLLCAAEKNIPVFEYTPLQVKVALTGYGRAEKMQIGKMVKVLLKLEEIPKPDDTADALAVALTHAYSRKGRLS